MLTCMTYAKRDGKHNMSTSSGCPVGCLLTWLAVPREKGCHYSMWKEKRSREKRVEGKEVPAEQNAHIMKKKSATAMPGLDMLKIYWSCSSNTEGWRSKDVPGSPRCDLPVSVCNVWGGKNSSSPLTLLLSLHGCIHLQPEYYANWTRCLQSVSPSPSLCYCSHDRSSSCWLYIQLWWYSSPLPLLSPRSFPLRINLFKTQGSQLFLSTGFSSSSMPSPIFFPPALDFLASLAYSSLPFFCLLPDRTLSPSLC